MPKQETIMKQAANMALQKMGPHIPLKRRLTLNGLYRSSDLTYAAVCGYAGNTVAVHTCHHLQCVINHLVRNDNVLSLLCATFPARLAATFNGGGG
jgi:hypothetical protein